MKILYLKNFRRGFATNSSSTHSVIYKRQGEIFNDLNIFEMNYYDRFDDTIAASKEAKIKYIAANIWYNKPLFKIMCAFYPQMEVYSNMIDAKDEDGNPKFGMCARGELSFDRKYLEASVFYLKNLIEDEDVVIVGGSDEEDFVYSTTEGHEKVPTPGSIDRYSNRFIDGAIRNGNYWIGYGFNGKMRFKTERGECVPEYPELIDLNITNKCNNGCPFCYRDCTVDGEHADFEFLKYIINSIGNDKYDFNRRVEFSIGGGNVLLYPKLKELFEFIKENHHIINTTISAKDCHHLIHNNDQLELIKKYVSGIGVSVCSDADIQMMSDLKDALNGEVYMVAHMIPEMLGGDKTKEYTDKLACNCIYNYLFLGYKTSGRGSSQQYHKLSDQEFDKIFSDVFRASIDTTFAKTYKEQIDRSFENVDFTITFEEGEYSMYIDGVAKKAYKSSYQLDKPYDLSFGHYREFGKTWFNVIDAFKNIRKDGGFKTYEG